MADPFYDAIIFLALVILEILAMQAWFAPYFRFGIPVASTRASLPAVEPSTLPAALEQRFKGRPEHPTIRFKALGDAHVPVRPIALRETFFENRAGFKYLPVIHSVIRLHPERGQFSITGYINWYVLFTLAYLVYRTLTDQSFILVAILILLILGVSYATQSGVNRRIAAEMVDALAQG